ncbi:MAG: allantoicase [Deltaproteobacteria bacterium]|nr:allantoicase [Deltaproteobacteria bacterium]
MKEAAAASFTGLIDLAAAALGGRALGASDQFFAGVDNLILPGRGVFIADKFTEQGKWMDGWESRRKRSAGHDFCILQLGVAGRVLGLDIDTNHFCGNHPHFASVDGLIAPKDTPFEALTSLRWSELLGQVPLRPTAQNLFATNDIGAVTHLRLNIFPDGGVARFRAYGRVAADWAPPVLDDETRAHVAAGLVDLAAVTNGGLARACSDAHFGPMNNLLLPGRGIDMGAGWETRRNRGPGHDWIIVQLGARGRAQVVEVDTNHFKGNYPDRCSIDLCDAKDARITDLIASGDWQTVIPETKLQAHTRHFLTPSAQPTATHLRLNIFPDGGCSRLRVWGSRAD